MKNKSSSFERLLFTVLIVIGAQLLFQRFWGPKPNAGTGPAQSAKTLKQAWDGIAPGEGTPLTSATAGAELKALNAQLAKNSTDDLSYWTRLRIALIQQYGLTGKADLGAARKNYDEVITHAAGDDLEAQALYQEGDALWHENAAAPGQAPPESKLYEAATSLERLIHRGRGASQFLEKSIYVPRDAKNVVGAPMLGPSTLPPSFTLAKVSDLASNKYGPQVSILERVNTYYKTTIGYKILDGVVKLLGSNAAYSYGLAIILFAACTRILMQPATRKQYESMKGMSVIAPEMKKIQDRYKGKTEQAAQLKMMGEIRELQKRHGVNPYLGCFLVLPQILLFLFIISPFIQHYEAKLELAGAHFGWIQNLAHPDIPLLVIYTLSQFVSIRLSATAPTDDQQRQMQMMSTFMPFIFGFFLLSWPSAFTLYWMTYNVLSTVFQWRLLKANDPTKNIFKTLTTSPFAIVAPDGTAVVSSADAVPARPKSIASKPQVKTLNPVEAVPSRKKSANVAVSSGDSALNGSLNGETSAFDEAQSSIGNDDWDGDAPNGVVKNGAGGAARNANSQRARRRRRH